MHHGSVKALAAGKFGVDVERIVIAGKDRELAQFLGTDDEIDAGADAFAQFAPGDVAAFGDAHNLLPISSANTPTFFRRSTCAAEKVTEKARSTDSTRRM